MATEAGLIQIFRTWTVLFNWFLLFMIFTVFSVFRNFWLSKIAFSVKFCEFCFLPKFCEICQFSISQKTGDSILGVPFPRLSISPWHHWRVHWGACTARPGCWWCGSWARAGRWCGVPGCGTGSSRRRWPGPWSPTAGWGPRNDSSRSTAWWWSHPCGTVAAAGL